MSHQQVIQASLKVIPTTLHKKLVKQPTFWLSLIYNFKFRSAFSHGWPTLPHNMHP